MAVEGEAEQVGDVATSMKYLKNAKTRSLRRVRSTLKAQSPLSVGLTIKSKVYSKDISNQNPVNSTLGQCVDDRPKPHQRRRQKREVVQPTTEQGT